ncbi:hypothetical protein V8E36_005440 [Tilletia maclaganii]
MHHPLLHTLLPAYCARTTAGCCVGVKLTFAVACRPHHMQPSTVKHNHAPFHPDVQVASRSDLPRTGACAGPPSWCTLAAGSRTCPSSCSQRRVGRRRPAGTLRIATSQAFMLTHHHTLSKCFPLPTSQSHSSSCYRRPELVLLHSLWTGAERAVHSRACFALLLLPIF